MPTDDLRPSLVSRLRAERLEPGAWSNGPGDRYAAHAHDYDKVLVAARGSIRFGLPGLGRAVELTAGDRLDLPARARRLASTYRLPTPVRISWSDSMTSRWGSCSRSGTVSLNWRLVQTPDFVRDYICVHELMHRREMNHSARYWRHVAEAFPRWEEAERWLKANGGLLR